MKTNINTTLCNFLIKPEGQRVWTSFICLAKNDFDFLREYLDFDLGLHRSRIKSINFIKYINSDIEVHKINYSNITITIQLVRNIQYNVYKPKAFFTKKDIAQL